MHRRSTASICAAFLVYVCALQRRRTVMKPHCVRDEKIALETEK